MGCHEYFVSSKKYKPEEIGVYFDKYKNEYVDIVCQSKLLVDVRENKVRVFGSDEEVKPFSLAKGTRGLIVSFDGTSPSKKIFPLLMRRHIKFTILENIRNGKNVVNQHLGYKSLFNDSKVEIKGKIYDCPLIEKEPLKAKESNVKIKEQKESLENRIKLAKSEYESKGNSQSVKKEIVEKERF